MLGMALFELQKFDASAKAFGAAKSDKRSRKTATQWIAYVKSEKSRKKNLEESLKRRRR